MMEDFTFLLERLLRCIDQCNRILFDTWVVAVVVGIALCFFGFRIFRFSVFAFGFITGATVGLGIGDLLYRPWGGVVGSLILGMMGGYVFLFLIRIAGFLLGLLLGGMLGVFFLGQSLWIVLVALLSGICGLFFLRYFIMASTSCWGAVLAAGGFFTFSHLPYYRYRSLLLLCETFLFLLGFTYQIFLTRRQSLLPRQ